MPYTKRFLFTILGVATGLLVTVYVVFAESSEPLPEPPGAATVSLDSDDEGAAPVAPYSEAVSTSTVATTSTETLSLESAPTTTTSLEESDPPVVAELPPPHDVAPVATAPAAAEDISALESSYLPTVPEREGLKDVFAAMGIESPRDCHTPEARTYFTHPGECMRLLRTSF